MERERSTSLIEQLRQMEIECKASSDNELKLTDQVTKLMMAKKELEEQVIRVEEKL
jgi:hypothetical protein